jgi:4-hydroxy-2-oxoheptanedioate aldolase
MFPNQLKIKLQNNEPILGIMAPNRDPILVETIGLLGFDCYMIDGEHGAITAVDVENLCRAAELRGITPMARVRGLDEKLILQFLDAGVMGIMMPTVTSKKEAQDLVDACKYAPIGKRGLGPVRAATYMLGMAQADYVKMANAETLVLPQIEEIVAVEHLEDILSVEGVDGIILGPRDLAMSMGFIDGPAHDEVKAVIDDVRKRTLAAGKLYGTVAGNGAQAKTLIEQGAHIVLGSVQNLLSVGAKDFLSARS